MAYVKRLVILANSRKTSGRCVAGKEVRAAGWGPWIRPVSARPTQELSEEERRFEDGQDPGIGDIVDVPLLEACPHAYQQENHLIDALHWRRTGRSRWRQLLAAVDAVRGPLWPDGFSSSKGMNDRVPENVALTLEQSLYLIGPLPIELLVEPGWEGRREVRGTFVYDGRDYRLKVTDPRVEREYLRQPDGRYRINEALVCLSLGELFHGFTYKLVAAVIRPSIDHS